MFNYLSLNEPDVYRRVLYSLYRNIGDYINSAIAGISDIVVQEASKRIKFSCRVKTSLMGFVYSNGYNI